MDVTATELLSHYNPISLKHPNGTNWTFEEMRKCRYDFNDSPALLHLPFLYEPNVWNDEGDCIVEQCVAIEKSWTI